MKDKRENMSVGAVETWRATSLQIVNLKSKIVN